MSALPERYVIGGLLGVGGMGSVYAAELHAAEPSQSRIAVKMLHDSLSTDPRMVARFGDEARAAQRVAHRNVVRVLDHGALANGAPFLVMDRVDGTPLGDLINDCGPLPLSRIRRIAGQLLSGLAAIHRAGLIHGDMKSDNVLVDPCRDDHVTIIDFGLARSPSATPLADDERLVSGTPDYMAPELIRGEPITEAADLYAVGIILYEMLTGTTPFAGGSIAAVFERHLADDVVPPSLRCPDRTIPVSLESLILRALDKEPGARHLNAEMFATAIERSIAVAQPERMMTVKPNAFSTSAPTRDWSRARFAEGTLPKRPRRKSRRGELREAMASRNPDAIVAACLGLTEQMIAERRLVPAARELESTLDWLATEGIVTDSVWRLQLTLATLYKGVDDRERARRAATEARDAARRAANRSGISRAEGLLRRLGAAPAQR